MGWTRMHIPSMEVSLPIRLRERWSPVYCCTTYTHHKYGTRVFLQPPHDAASIYTLVNALRCTHFFVCAGADDVWDASPEAYRIVQRRLLDPTDVYCASRDIPHCTPRLCTPSTAFAIHLTKHHIALNSMLQCAISPRDPVRTTSVGSIISYRGGISVVVIPIMCKEGLLVWDIQLRAVRICRVRHPCIMQAVEFAKAHLLGRLYPAEATWSLYIDGVTGVLPGGRVAEYKAVEAVMRQQFTKINTHVHMYNAIEEQFAYGINCSLGECLSMAHPMMSRVDDTTMLLHGLEYPHRGDICTFAC